MEDDPKSELTESQDDDDEELFLDSLDSEESPFYDCPDSFDPPQSSSESFLSPSSFGLRRRRYRTLNESLQLDSHTPVSASTQLIDDAPFQDDTPIKLDSDTSQAASVTLINTSTTTPPILSHDGIGKQNIQTQGQSHDAQFSFLVFLAELLLKAIGFQFNLLITLITFPIWAFYYSCIFAVNPLRVLKRFRICLLTKLTTLWNHVWKTVSPFVTEWFKQHKSLLKLALRCGWGLFWSLYVCCTLFTFLISAFVISGVLMRCYLLQEPFQLKQGLNFDYTKTKPVAFVPITSCPAQESGQTQNKLDIGDGDYDGALRVIPPNHKLQASVSLILPESGYNRHLGIFQIRLEFLSEKGKSLGSVSHPGMLEFRSKPIRLLSTLLKAIPLVAGYVSEAQTLELKFRGYREDYIPTACIKVTIEQRAEFRAGAGIPEVYDADLYLESELPFLKRMLWYWRRTLFVWLSMLIFVMELLIALVCCRPIILPRASNTSRNSHQR